MSESVDHFQDAKNGFNDLDATIRSVEGIIKSHTAAVLQRSHANIDRVESRPKSYLSIRRNYLKKFGVPKSAIDLNEFLRDSNDLIGVRIVVYYNSDVDLIRDLMTEIYPNAQIEEKLTVDDIDRGSQFGYRAVHVNFEFLDANIFRGCAINKAGVEIQIRTVLSDAWARHSHKLLYKRDSAPHDGLIRGFASTAAMLEAIDEKIEELRHTPSVAERYPVSVELTWTETYNTICEILECSLDEPSLKSFYLSTFGLDAVGLQRVADDSIESSASFVEMVRTAWGLHGNINFEKYGFRDGVLKLKIALFGTFRARFNSIIPLHMRAKVEKILNVGARGT